MALATSLCTNSATGSTRSPRRIGSAIIVPYFTPWERDSVWGVCCVRGVGVRWNRLISSLANLTSNAFLRQSSRKKGSNIRTSWTLTAPKRVNSVNDWRLAVAFRRLSNLKTRIQLSRPTCWGKRCSKRLGKHAKALCRKMSWNCILSKWRPFTKFLRIIPFSCRGMSLCWKMQCPWWPSTDMCTCLARCGFLVRLLSQRPLWSWESLTRRASPYDASFVAKKRALVSSVRHRDARFRSMWSVREGKTTAWIWKEWIKCVGLRYSTFSAKNIGLENRSKNLKKITEKRSKKFASSVSWSTSGMILLGRQSLKSPSRKESNRGCTPHHPDPLPRRRFWHRKGRNYSLSKKNKWKKERTKESSSTKNANNRSRIASTKNSKRSRPRLRRCRHLHRNASSSAKQPPWPRKSY